MTLQFVIGRSGAGKTSYCHEQIRGQLRQSPLGAPLIMLVPEQVTFQTEYDMLQGSDLTGTLRAQALSFRRLAYRVMQETGGISRIPISDTGKYMLLYKTLHKLKGQLRLYKHGAEQGGLIERIAELLTEWKRYGLDASGLQEYTDRMTASGEDTLLQYKLQDLQLIYEQMELELAQRYLDNEDCLRMLAEGIGQAASMRGCKIWIDGFHGFTPQELVALEAIMRTADSVIMTLTLDRPYGIEERPHELELFHPTALTYSQVLGLAQNASIPVLDTICLSVQSEIPPRFYDSPMLRHLEAHFRYRTPLLTTEQVQLDYRNPQCGLSLHAASSRRAEVEAVARDIRLRSQQNGLRYRDMAIMVRNAEDYADYISQVMADYEIPFFVDQKQRADYHPLVEFIRSALEVVIHGWHYDAVFRCVKTELLFPEEGTLLRESFDLLENFVLASGIDGWKWRDETRWHLRDNTPLDEEDPVRLEASERARQEFDVVMRAREAIVSPLAGFGTALDKAMSIREMCHALYELLSSTGAAMKLEKWSVLETEAGLHQRARSHRQLWDSVMQLLDQLVELAGEDKVSTDLFAGMIEAGLDSLRLAAVPPALDQVLVGSLDRTRAGSIKVCYILGVNDGVIPARMTEDSILTENERDVLTARGIEMAPCARRRLLDERFILYLGVTLPSQHLWVSWAQADTEGKTLLPSEAVRQLAQMFPRLPVYEHSIEPETSMDAAEQADYLSHPERALSYLITMLQHWREGAEIPPLWWDVYNWLAARPKWRDQLGLLLYSFQYTNKEQPLRALTAQKLYGSLLRASVSRMERFVSCPFQHFAVYGLRLRERKQYRLDAPDVGQLFHAALTRLVRELGDQLGQLSDDELRKVAHKAADEIAPRLQSQILLSSSRFGYIAGKLREVIGQAAVMLGEHARRSKFKPAGVEMGFGPGESIPALEVDMPGGGKLEIVGRIDRVDVAYTEEGALLRVLDYKSSATQLRLEKVIYGLSLQMLAYLDVLLTHATKWLGEEASPAGVLYFHVHNPVLALANQLDEQGVRKELLRRFKTKGLLLAEPQAVRLMDEELASGHSELLPVAITKNDQFYTNSSVASKQQWSALRNYTRQMIGEIGESIQTGEIGITPYRMGDQTPCQFCDYKAVCQFDLQFQGNVNNRFSKLGKDKIWQVIGEGEGHDDGPASS